MKITHIISSLDVTIGGPARSVGLLVYYLSKHNNFSYKIVTGHSESPITKLYEELQDSVVFSKKSRLGRLYSLNMEFPRPNLYHGQGVWEYSIHQMAKLARQNNIPYIISPRGMLEPWPLSQGKWKKLVAFKLYQRRDLERSSCIHATSEQEADNIRGLGIKNPIAIIPNGIDLSSYPRSFPKKSSERKKVVFISRIHPKKGIENLIAAWSLLPKETRSKWTVNIYGNGDKAYIDYLNGLLISKNLMDEIIISAPIYNNEKILVYRRANLFVLPTYSENFGLVVAEALASYTPVITTVAAPWRELESKGCGWWIDIGIDPLKKALVDAMGRNDKDIQEMGIRGRALVEDRFALDSVSRQMAELYAWILGINKKPGFVRID